MSPIIVGLIGIVVLIIIFFFRMPIAYAMIFVGFIGFTYLVSVKGGFNIIAKDFYYTFATYTLTVIPLFVWMGYIAFNSGISRRLYAAAYKLIGNQPGGLAMATQMACAAFGAVCGSQTATAGTMGAVSLPEMKRYNYDSALATASVASGGILGMMIPPSVVLIVYGIATEQSIGKLFIAGIFPGILLMLLFMGTIYVQAKLNPSLAPPGPRTSFKEKALALSGGTAETLIIFAVVIGGLLAGFFTPTEAGSVGALAVLVLSLIRRQLSWQGFTNSLVETTRVTAMIFLLITGAIIFGRFIATSHIPAEITSWAGGLPMPPVVILGIVLLAFLILGCFIDALALILLTIPIFFPLVMSLGYDPIWFGVIMVLVAGMGVITPPVGVNVYIIFGVAKDVPLMTIFSGIWPFLGALIICTIILIAFPQVALFLPSFITY